LQISNKAVTLPTTPSNNNHINLSSWFIDPDEIYDYFISLDLHSETGPDGIPSMFLKCCNPILVMPRNFICS